MPPIRWPLRHRRPTIAVTLPQAKGRRVRRLIADTGAGTDRAAFELLLREVDCRAAGDPLVMGQVQLGGAYAGWFNVYSIEVRIAKLNFSAFVSVAGVPRVPDGFDGIASFKFLNRFHYGNLGDPDRFGLQS
jgi:hypothetical protein